MLSTFVEYELKTTRNPFKLNMEQKQLKDIKNSTVNFLSEKNKLLLHKSTPKLRLLYNPQISRQSSFMNMNKSGTQSVKRNFFQFKNNEKQPSQHFQQKSSDYESSLIIGNNGQSFKSSSDILRNYSSEIQSPLKKSQTIDSEVRLRRTELMRKQQKLIKKLPSIKSLSIFKSQASKNLLASKEIRKSSLEMVLKPIKRREKSGLRGSESGSKKLNNNIKSARFEYQLDNQLASDEKSFTFGKPSSSQKS